MPVGVDIQMRRLERKSCNVKGPDSVWKTEIAEHEDRRVLGDRRVSSHRPDDEGIWFMDRHGNDEDVANPGLEVFESGQDLITHQHLADGAILGSSRQRRTDK